MLHATTFNNNYDDDGENTANSSSQWSVMVEDEVGRVASVSCTSTLIQQHHATSLVLVSCSRRVRVFRACSIDSKI
jgi:hypothetical protein